MRKTLVVMVKEPRPGRVKTRLGRDIGMTASAWWFRHQVTALLRRVESPKWELVLAVAPDVAGLTSRIWPEHLHRIPQGRGDLGARMARILRFMPPGPVCIIGADIPGITSEKIEQAFAALGAHDAVFGPADDGGYWLIGMKRSGGVPNDALTGVRWSTDHALQDSAHSLGTMRIAHVATLRDVDTLSDLKALSR
ncbi:TIGR04282 family arsenosugar biosynthesis glycosyltransferase [Cognatishimia maritima]|uniref:Glycosyltransferase n=1 Tax=Cognatishimia maritima TaxID=870908 RepID=A0A1M5NRS8_9RHOB|nr:TIGR04282 family arsenosugar biosynthesis glycosyltransferase [Cognatishimia maritima]SHG92314.1 hypothetical protein SAMN04488044_1616 [Cognatishimia maritima]